MLIVVYFCRVSRNECDSMDLGVSWTWTCSWMCETVLVVEGEAEGTPSFLIGPLHAADRVSCCIIHVDWSSI